MRNWQVIALLIGGAGSFLAFLGQEAWIAVTTSGTVTVGALANLQLYGRTYLLYFRAAKDLENLSNSISPEERQSKTPEDSVDIICQFEEIFRREGELWREQAQDALAQVDAGISDLAETSSSRRYDPVVMYVPLAFIVTSVELRWSLSSYNPRCNRAP